MNWPYYEHRLEDFRQQMIYLTNVEKPENPVYVKEDYLMYKKHKI
jgi:hypothetical protein